jgi:hypothetical protein
MWRCPPGPHLGLCRLPQAVRGRVAEFVGCRLHHRRHPLAALIAGCQFDAAPLRVYCAEAHAQWLRANCPGPCRPVPLWPRRAAPRLAALSLAARRRFQFLPLRPLRRPPAATHVAPLPRALQPAGYPPQALRLGVPLLSFDVRTHTWADAAPTRATRGPNGHYWFAPAPGGVQARILQLAWAAGDGPAQVRTLQHSDAVLAESKTTALEGLDAAAAQPPTAALRDFVADVEQVAGRGGVLVSHHLELDAVTVSRELKLAGLPGDTWAAAVRSCGFCLMSPYLGRWLRECAGEEIPPSAMPCLSLRELCARLSQEALAGDAGTSARVALHALLFHEAARLAGLAERPAP